MRKTDGQISKKDGQTEYARGGACGGVESIRTTGFTGSIRLLVEASPAGISRRDECSKQQTGDDMRYSLLINNRSRKPVSKVEVERDCV